MNFKIKRYAITIAFAVIITLCIGTFYIQAGDHRYPEYTLTHQQGNENEAKNVSLRGTYNENNHIRMSPSVTIGIEGSQYTSEQSFLERMDSYFYSGEDVKKLVQEHRQFMRGKGGGYNSFYQDDDLLVYVKVESDYSSQAGSTDFRFVVDVLEKKENKSWSYEASLPDSKLYQFINLNDVQVYQDEIIVLTRNHNRNDNRSEFHRYSLILKSGKLTNLTDRMIEFPFSENLSSDGDTKTNSNLEIILDSNLMGSGRYHVFFATETQHMERNKLTTSQAGIKRDVDVSYQEILSAQIMIYDIQTAQWEKINIPEIIDFLDVPLDSARLNTKLEGNQLYLTKHTDQAVSVMEYNILDEKATRYDVVINSIIRSAVKEDRIYMLTEDDKAGGSHTSLTIADLESGDQLYQGTIEVSGAESDEADVFNRLEIYQINIK